MNNENEKQAVRPETTSEHMARDMREGRFPERSELSMVPVSKTLAGERSHLAEIAANIGDIDVAEIIPAIRKFTSALVEIDGNGTAKEPSNYPTVGFPPARPDEDDRANEVVREAFEEGVIRGRWEMSDIARAAILAARASS